MNQKRAARAAWVWLTVATVFAVAALSAVRTMDARQTVTVHAWQVTPCAVKETVVCAGVIEARDGTAVYATMPCVVGTVEVAVGEAVKAGDVLVTVDRTATAAKALEMGAQATQSALVSAALPATVTAPTDGVVSALHVKSGEFTDGQSPLAVLSDGEERAVAITVPESALPLVAVGQTVRVSGVAFAKDSYDGVLRSLASSARTTVSANGSRTVVDGVVTLDPSQVDASLLTGLTAKATITVRTRERAMVIPYEAVIKRAGQTATVYCLDGGEAVRRRVTVAGDTPTGVEIQDGLQMGEWVVADAQGLSAERVDIEVEAVACRS